MRINRFLAASGLGSRRSCEELILTGKVTINGQICQNLATEVSEADFVKVGSRRILPEKHLYILLHKPRGYLCTASDTHDRHTIFELLPAHWPRLFHVGRLDRDSEGLLILTNDGDLGLHLTHPRYKIEKEYEVLLDRPFDTAKDTPRLLHGVSNRRRPCKGGLRAADVTGASADRTAPGPEAADSPHALQGRLRGEAADPYPDRRVAADGAPGGRMAGIDGRRGKGIAG